MPGFDRTGPSGEGSRTGRGLGKCNPKNQDAENNSQADSETEQRNGRGLRRGLGFGRKIRGGQGFGRNRAR